MDYTTAASSSVKEINALETKTVTIDARVEFPQNPQYTSVVNSIWQTSVPSEYATILDLKINVPADGTYTGVSVRSESGKALSGHLGVFENGYVAAESETESVKSKFSTNNFKKIRIPQFSETRFGSFVGLFSSFDVYKQ